MASPSSTGSPYESSSRRVSLQQSAVRCWTSRTGLYAQSRSFLGKCDTIPQRRLFGMSSGFCASVEALLWHGGGTCVVFATACGVWCLGGPSETLSWPSCPLEALTFDQRNLSPEREMCLKFLGHCHQRVTKEVHVDRKERVFQLVCNELQETQLFETPSHLAVPCAVGYMHLFVYLDVTACANCTVLLCFVVYPLVWCRCCVDLSLLPPWTLSLHHAHISGRFLIQTGTTHGLQFSLRKRKK